MSANDVCQPHSCKKSGTIGAKLYGARHINQKRVNALARKIGTAAKPAGRLTKKERAFVREMAVTNDPNYSAARAKYAVPQTDGYRVAKRPDVARAIVEEQFRVLTDELSPKSIRAIDHILDPNNTACPFSVRFQAARYVLDKAHALVTAPSESNKAPEDMTADELRAELRRLETLQAITESAIAAKATLVQGEVIDADAPNLGGIFD